MPSGRTTYRTYDQIIAEMEALATPTRTWSRSRPRRTRASRAATIKYLEITNNVSAKDGKPVFFNMGPIHGNEWAAAEDRLEFIYDVIHSARPTRRSRRSSTRSASSPCRSSTPTASCATAARTAAARSCPRDVLDVRQRRRHEPQLSVRLGLEHRRHVRRARRRPGLGARGQEHDGHREEQPGRGPGHEALELARVLLPGPGDRAGCPPTSTRIRDLSLAMAAATNNGYTNVRDSAHDYETSGETIDWSYYATRGFAVTLELVGARICSGCPTRRCRTTSTARRPTTPARRARRPPPRRPHAPPPADLLSCRTALGHQGHRGPARR